MKNIRSRGASIFCLLVGLMWGGGEAVGAVVINEIFYHAPGELDELQYLELYNSSDATVDLGGWSFAKGIEFRFPTGARIEPRGFAVLCRNAEIFSRFYEAPVAGVFGKTLKHRGERIELRDREGQVVDSVKFSNQEPWPLGAGGFSGSLERISPSGPSELPQNWASSTLSADSNLPGGSPGRTNTCHSALLPPVVRGVHIHPAHPHPDESVTVSADVDDGRGLSEVWVRYRLVGAGSEGEEMGLRMAPAGGGSFSATIPPQPADHILRVRVQALGRDGTERWFPDANEPRPAISAYVHTNLPLAAVPQGFIIHTRQVDLERSQQTRARGGVGPSFARGGGNNDAQTRGRAERALRAASDMSRAWAQLVVGGTPDTNRLAALREVFIRQRRNGEKSVREFMEGFRPGQGLEPVRNEIRSRRAAFLAEVTAILAEPDRAAFEAWWSREVGAGTSRAPKASSPPEALRSVFDPERDLALATLSEEVAIGLIPAVRAAFLKAIEQRDGLKAFAASASEEENGAALIRDRVDPIRSQLRREVGAILGPQALAKLEAPPPPRPRTGVAPGTPVHGAAAFVYVEPGADRPQLFDFVSANERSAGFKVHFQKDRPLGGMTTVNLIFEQMERFVLAEPMAFEFYRRAGNASCRTDFVRLTIDGDPLGYHLLCEQPNKAFLRENKLRDDGNLYKLIWFGNGLAGQHEKKTHLGEGYADLEATLKAIDDAPEGDARWAVIRREFDVEQVINYFAVNLCLSHWDGFFNNYFAYHDVGGSGKWTLYPWDQDKTWGYHDGISDNEVFFDMPTSFGMEGDRPPGLINALFNPRSFGVGHIWWRAGGWFSRPLLANPNFRKLYLARVKELLQTEYTPAKWEPGFLAMEERLREEVRYRAALRGESPEEAAQRLKEHVNLLREHLRKRRKFLLAQEEISGAGAFDRAALKENQAGK